MQQDQVLFLKDQELEKEFFLFFIIIDFDYLDIHNKNDLKIANFILKKKLFKIT